MRVHLESEINVEQQLLILKTFVQVTIKKVGLFELCNQN
jgi:hypothetical protein